ncbi:MAG: fasciclin domain-containing protein [Vampirovibrionales bacterium]
MINLYPTPKSHSYPTAPYRLGMPAYVQPQASTYQQKPITQFMGHPPINIWGPSAYRPPSHVRQPEGVNALVGNKDFATLTTALGAAGLVDAVKKLDIKNPITVLAPTNAAFGKLDPSLLQSLLKPENKAFLQQVLQYHVSDMKSPAAQQVGTFGFDSLLSNNQDDTLTTTNPNGKITLRNGAQKIETFN